MARVELSYTEHPKSMNGKGKYTSVEKQYLVFDVTSEEDALTAVYQTALKTVSGLPLDSIEIDARETPTAFRVNVLYKEQETASASTSSKDNEEEEEEQPTVSFDCGGGTKHLLYSLSQKRLYGDKDAGGAIGWNGKVGDDCEIAGVDIPTAQLRETYTKPMRISSLTTSFKKKVAALVGKVNSSTFKGWAPGEMMFLGMSYSTPTKSASKVTVSFNFSIQPNESNVSVGQKKVSKKGFEYIWAISKTNISNGKPSLEVEGIYQEQVCETANFSNLGL